MLAQKGEEMTQRMLKTIGVMGKGSRALMCAGLCLLGLSAYAQQTAPSNDEYPLWLQMMNDPNANFFETQKAFETYFETHEATPGSGYKPFKRWEHHMQGRVDAEGNKPAPGSALKAYRNLNMRSNNGDWRPLGPTFNDHTNFGIINGVGRVNTIHFHPTNPDVIYLGAPSGGLWISENHGASWRELTDHLPTLGVSSIAFDPVNPDIMYIGTGDRDAADAPGLGVWKSLDGGTTWTQSNTGMGDLEVHKLIVTPDDGQIILAATNQGMYRSIDAGANWTLQGFAFEYRDMTIHPTNTNILYAFGANSFNRSEDRGVTWQMVTDGIPNAPRMLIAVSPAAPDVVYAVQANTFDFRGFYRSEDAGKTFSFRSDSPNILGRASDGSDVGVGQAWYDMSFAVDPFDADVVYVGGIHIWKSKDQGVEWEIISQSKVHVDHHYLNFSPHDHALYAGHDGGIHRTYSDGLVWEDVSTKLVIGQIYRIGQSRFDGNRMLCGFQDNGTMETYGLSWDNVMGGDGMECAIDYTDDDYSYATFQYGPLSRRVGDGGFRRIARNDDIDDDQGAWVTPFVLGYENANTIFIGYQNIWRTRNAKTADHQDVSWTNITNDQLGGSTQNFNLLRNSPADPDVLYATKNNGLYRTDNANDTTTVNWINLTSNAPVGSGSTTIRALECHPTNPNMVYMARNNKVFRSDDKGLSWVDISLSLPDISINTIAYDSSTNEGIYVGTDIGVFYTNSTLGDWENFSTGFPVSVEVTELEIFYSSNPSEHRLRAGTYGRGAWESDLYGTTNNGYPAFANVVLQNEPKPIFDPFTIEFGFYRNLNNVEVTGVELSDLTVVNGTASNLAGGPINYTALITPSALGTVEISIPDAAATDLNGLTTKPSPVLEVEYTNEPEGLGIFGPGGVGDQQSMAIWLRAGEGMFDAIGGAEVSQQGDRVGQWMDQMGNSIFAEQTDTESRPSLATGAEGINGLPALMLDTTGIPEYLLINDLSPGRNVTVMTVAQSIPERFNQHAWMGSSRMSNGFIMHNWEGSNNFSSFTRDSDDTQIEPGRFWTNDIQIPHVYGLSFNQVGNTYFDYINFVDWQERKDIEIPDNFGARNDTTLIDVFLGRDRDDRFGYGKIGEFIVFNHRLQRSHRTIVKNYLGAKYNIDMGPDDHYDFPTHGSEVAGIGRETVTDFHANAIGTGLVRMSNPTDLDDGEYLHWGHDQGAIDAWTALPAPQGVQRIERSWGLDETGNAGEVKITIAATDLPATTESYGLMISHNADFSGVPLGVVLTPDLTGDSLTATVNFPDNSYFTIVNGTVAAIENLTSVDDYYRENPQWQVFPNPNNGSFTVHVETEFLQGPARLELYNPIGQHLQTEAIFGSGDFRWESSDLAAGIYVLRLVVGERVETMQVVVE